MFRDHQPRGGNRPGSVESGAGHLDILGGPLLALWRISRACSSSTCVAMLTVGQSVYVRDTKNGGDQLQPVITLHLKQWLAFVGAVIGGSSAIDHLGGEVSAGGLAALRTAGGDVQFRCVESGTSLTFDEAEWRAFVIGALAGDFGHPLEGVQAPLARLS